MRRPKVHEMFGGQQDPGLSNVIVGKTELNKALKESADITGLTTLAAGHIPPNPSELLGSHKFKEFLKTLQVLPPGEKDIRRTTAYGTPEQVVESLTRLATILGRYPESHLVLRLHYPGMTAEPAAGAIRLLAREVAPRLKEIAAAA